MPVSEGCRYLEKCTSCLCPGWSSSEAAKLLSPVRFFTSLTTGIFGVRSVTILVEHSLFVGGKEKQQTTTYFIQVSLFQISWDYVNVDLFFKLPHASFCFICSPKFSHMGQDLLISTGQKLSKTHTGALTLKCLKLSSSSMKFQEEHS